MTVPIQQRSGFNKPASKTALLIKLVLPPIRGSPITDDYPKVILFIFFKKIFFTRIVDSQLYLEIRSFAGEVSAV